MQLSTLLALQVLAHLLADYTFQPDHKAKEKNQHGFGSPFLKWHILVTWGFAWMLSLQWPFVAAASAIALFHWLVDGCKPFVARVGAMARYTFFIDQAAHLVAVFGVVTVHYRIFGASPVAVDPKSVWWALAFVAAAKPANILIKELFSFFNVSAKVDGNGGELPNAGKLIGALERWLVLVFILSTHFEAIGFLIAAKSILRFKDTDTLKTEYVLIGTMLSFGIAIVLGLLLTFAK